jgi:hypothetical protein
MGSEIYEIEMTATDVRPNKPDGGDGEAVLLVAAGAATARRG